MLHADKPSGRASSALRRVAELNKPPPVGNGIPTGHFIPLCKYHNPSIAIELSQRLQDNGIHVKIQTTRMNTLLSVAFEDRDKAFAMLNEFTESHLDSRPKKFSRDYDFVLLIAIATAIVAAISCFVPTFNRLAPFAVITTGISLSLVVEQRHRHCRYRNGLNYSLSEIMILISLFALNFAVWRLAL